MVKRFDLDIAGKQLAFETGRIAKQADGSVTIQMGGTVVLVAAVCSKEAKKETDFVPLTVEYQERMYAGGKIPGGFFKREGRPSEKEILSARLVDRPIRPLFPKGMCNEVQVICIVLSADMENDPDIMAVNGASAALTISDIPFDGPVAAVRVGRIGEGFVINPTFKDLEASSLDLVVVGREDDIIMIEAGSNELSEEVIYEGIALAQRHIKEIIALQRRMAGELGVKKREAAIYSVDEALASKVKERALGRLHEIVKMPIKERREEALDMLKKELVETLVSEENDISESDVKFALEKIECEVIRGMILEKGFRIDGRRRTEIRPITCEIGTLPRAHGSGLFTRGQTQSLAVTTLGTADDEQRIDALEGESTKNFMLHYNFPPFSVGEVKPVRGPGRREIGHGALAERALKPMMPAKEAFPYTVRLVSDILESNGSSSMATVCAGTLALMDAGVPVKKPVGGIAMGLVKEGERYIILTDIAGVEDHFGDMDFKVAGTKDGVTAIQLDLKISGISLKMVREILDEAKTARAAVLGKIMEVIDRPKDAISKYAPRIVSFKIDVEKIRDVIGSGGKVIRKIIADTGAEINIEDDGTVQVASADAEALDKAIAIIKGIVEEPEVGKIYKGPVKRIMDFGVFVEILPGKEGLCHVSELAAHYVKDPAEVVKIGDEIEVKLVEIDNMGRYNLSKVQTDPNYVPRQRPERDRGDGERRKDYDPTKKRR